MPKRSEVEIFIREVGSSHVVDIGGEVDLYQSPMVRKNLAEVFAKNPKRFLVNLSKVTYMDSSGLATLIEAFQISKKQGTFFGIFGVSATLQGLFEITRLEKVFSIFKDEAEALLGRSSV